MNFRFLLDAAGLDILLLHDPVKKINRTALDLTIRDSDLAQMSPSVTRKTLTCLVPAATKLANMDLSTGV